MFPQDQLGVLVKTHIEEQTKKFDRSEAKLQNCLRELEAVQEQVLPLPRTAAAPFRSGGGSSVGGGVGCSGGAAAASASREVSRGWSDVAATDDEFRECLREDSAAAAAAAAVADGRSGSVTFSAAAAQFTSLLQDAPIVLGLQAAVSRLERQLLHALSGWQEATGRLTALEEENQTLRLEVVALKAVVNEQGDALRDCQRRVQANIPSNSVAAAAAATSPSASASSGYSRSASDALPWIGKRSAEQSSNATKETVCDQCFAKAVCTPCTGCGSEWYCCVGCALQRREKHRVACELLRHLPTSTATAALGSRGTGGS